MTATAITTTAAEIIVVRQLDAGIYRSEGGGEQRVYSRHVSGPRGFANALRSHSDERRSATLGYGNIGCGGGWLEVVPRGGGPGSGVHLPSEFLANIEDSRLYARRFPEVAPASSLWSVPAGATLEWWRSQVVGW